MPANEEASNRRTSHRGPDPARRAVLLMPDLLQYKLSQNTLYLYLLKQTTDLFNMQINNLNFVVH